MSGTAAMKVNRVPEERLTGKRCKPFRHLKVVGLFPDDVVSRKQVVAVLGSLFRNFVLG